MDSLLPQLLEFPPHPPPPQPPSDAEYDKQIRSLVQLLNSTSASQLLQGVDGSGDLLEVLDPSINSLPYLYTLLAHINVQKDRPGGFTPSTPLWQKMLDFVARYDAVQVRYTGHEWRRLMEAILRGAEQGAKVMAAVVPIRTAILRLDPDSSTFTSTHLLFTRLCLRTRAFHAALPILDRDVYHFPSESERNPSLPLPCARHLTSSTYITTGSGLSDKLNYRDHLQYFLHGGMIYLALESWDRAALLLEIVMTSPAHGSTVSLIQVEAYKKWVLVNLLLYGKMKSMPRTVSGQAAKFYHSLAKQYDVLADAFKHPTIEKLYAEFSVAQSVWQHDSNLGLVLQVLSAHRRFQILSLSKVYAAISVPAITALTSTSESEHSASDVEIYIGSLIASGQLNASLHPSASSSPSVLRFYGASTPDGPLARSEAQQLEDLEVQAGKVERLAVHFRETQRRVELTREYLDQVRKVRRTEKERREEGTGAFNGLFGDSMGDMPGGFGGVDEDMLAEI